MPQKRKYDSIKRKQMIPEDKWTEGKQAAAQIIEDKIDSGEWPVPLTQLAQETDWSRAHYQNTLRDFFYPVDESHEQVDETSQEPMARDIQLSIPEGVDVESYVRGWIAGRKAN